MKFIRHKDAAGRLPEKENRKGTLRGILGLALMVTLGVVLAAGGTGTRTYAWNLDPPGIEEGGEWRTFPSTTGTSGQDNTKSGGETTSGGDTYILLGDEPAGAALEDPSDLEGYIKEKKLWKRNPDNGEWEEAQLDDAVVLGSNYKFTVSFEGGETGFQKEMHWDLGPDVECIPEPNGVLWDGNTKIGTYTLTADGKLDVTFTDEFLNGGNQNLKMSFYMTANKKEESGDYDFPWSGNITDEQVIGSTGGLDVEKTAGYYSSSGKINYTVTASVTEGMIMNGMLTDVMQPGLTYCDIVSMKILDYEGNDVSDRYRADIERLMAQAEGQEPGDGGEKLSEWTLGPLPPLSEGMQFVVEYRGEVAEEYQSQRDYVAKNTVTFTGDVPKPMEGEEPKSATDKEEKPIAKEQITKTGDTLVIGEGEKAEEVIQWQVRIGSGQWDPLETELNVKDTLGEGLKFRPQDGGITVNWCSEDGTVRKSVTIRWEDVEVSEDGKTINYKLNRNLFAPDYEWQSEDYLMVTYNTDFDPNNPPVKGYENTVENDIWAPKGVTGRLPVGEAIQKEVLDHEEAGYVEYTVVVDIPPISHMKSMFGDSGDGHPELHLPYYYIEDCLEFENKYYARNIPEDVTIHVEGKSGKTWDFVNVPCTSGNGDGSKEPETFQIVEGASGTFFIYFNTSRYGVGTEGELEKHDSIWDIDEATRMTIKYHIPYDTLFVDQDGNGMSDTLGDLLAEGLELDNKVYYKRSGVEQNDHARLQKFPEKGKLSKTARYLGDGVVEYRVSFLNQDGNNSRYIKSDDPNSSRLPELLNPTFVDDFDSHMEYVPGSLQVEIRNTSDSSEYVERHYVTYQYATDDGTIRNPVDPENPTRLSAPLLDFDYQTYKDGSVDRDHYNNLPIEVTFENTRRYVFVYQLKLKDEYRGWESVEDIKNTASLQLEGKNGPEPGDANIDIPSDMLQKDFELTEDKTLKYTLKVNPLALNLATIKTDTGEVNPSSYRLEDKMSDNLMLVTAPDGDYAIIVEYYDGSTWSPLKRSASAEGISKENFNYFRGIEGNNDIYFILPDELYVRITYEVRVEGEVNSQELASNTATLFADKTESDTKETFYKVGGSEGYGSSDPVVRLEKTDSQNKDKRLAGAKFALYTDQVQEGSEYSEYIDVEIPDPDNKDNSEAKKPVRLYKVGEYTTNDFGAINQITPPGDIKEYTGEGLYALVEEEAPANYVLDDTPVFFRFPGNTSPADEDKVTYKGEEYLVRHTLAHENIDVKNDPKYALRIDKVGNTNTQVGLSGAEFGFWSTVENGGSRVEGVLLATAVSSGENGTLEWTLEESAESAGVKFSGLDHTSLKLNPGIYYLKETKAPDGYVKLEHPIIVEVKSNGSITCTCTEDEKDVKIENKKGEIEGSEIPLITFYIPNPSSYELPETGGAGTSLLYLLGSMFILAGGMVLLYDRRITRGRSGR